MNNRVFHFGGFPIVLQNFFYVTRQEDFRKVFYYPFNSVVNIWTCNVAKEFSQKRIGFWNQFSRFLSAKIIQSWVVQTSRKHSVSNGLSVNVCKTLWRNVVNQNLLESQHLFFQRTVFLIFFITCQRLLNNIRKKAGFARHHFC